MEVNIVLEVIIAKFEVALGYSICLGPGVVVNELTGSCKCETELTIYDAEALGCICRPGTGLIFNEELTGCICEEPELFEYSGDEDKCISKPVTAIIEELDVYQMCVGNFFVESLELEEECQTTVYSGLFAADFSAFGQEDSDFGAGRLGAFLEGANLDFGDCVDVGLIIESEAFFSIDVLIGIISVFEIQQVDITAASFMTDLDALITVDFWATTAATFSLDLFAELEVEIELTTILVELQAGGEFVACFGPGAVVNAAGECECTIAHMVLDEELGTCGCAAEVDGVAAGFLFDEDLQECICEADKFFVLDVDAGLCIAMTAVEIKAELDVFQMCVGNFIAAELEVAGVTLEADIEVQFFQILFSLDFSVIGIGSFVDVFTDDFKASITALGVTELDINIFIASDTFYSITRLIDMLFIFQEAGVDITTTEFMAELDLVITAEFWAFTEITFTFDFMADFFVFIDITLTKVNIDWKSISLLNALDELNGRF